MAQRLLTNGPPKHGTHALAKACQMLSGAVCWPEHRTLAEGVPPDIMWHVFVARDPRNALVSLMRTRGAVNPGSFVAAVGGALHGGRPYADVLAEFHPWLTKAGHVIRYESLVADLETMRGLARYLKPLGRQLMTPEEALEHLPGLTLTWNVVHSDYHAIWTPEVIERCEALGLKDAVEAWGYSWNS